MMRILHFSREAWIGAPGRAAARLAAVLRGQETDSTLYTLAQARAEGWALDLNPHYAQLMRGVQEFDLDAHAASAVAGRVVLGYPGVVPPVRLLAQADVIHLHEMSGFISPRGIHRILRMGKPVVWSLSDAWAWTGGCQAPGPCRQFVEGCAECPLLTHDRFGMAAALWRDKARFRHEGTLVVTVPSAATAPHVSLSPALQDRPVRVLPAPDQEPWDEAARARVRAGLQLGAGAFVVLVVAEYVGGDSRRRVAVDALLAECGIYNAFKRLQREQELAVVVVGVPPNTLSSPWSLRCVPAISQAGEMAGLLAAADVVVLPHPDENNAEIVFEAAAARCPVVAYDAGFAADVMEDGVTGRLIPLGDVRGMAEAVSCMALQPGVRQTLADNIRSLAAGTEPAQASVCLDTYRELIAQSGPPGAASTPEGSVQEAADGSGLPVVIWPIVQGFIAEFTGGHTREREKQNAGQAQLRKEIERFKAGFVASREKLGTVERRLLRLKQHLRAEGGGEMSKSLSTIKKLHHRMHLAWQDCIRLEEEMAAQEGLTGAVPGPRKRSGTRLPPAAFGDALVRWIYPDASREQRPHRLGRLSQYEPCPLRLEHFPTPRLRPGRLPSIAVVTPSFNQGRFIEATIRSVIDQGYPDVRYAVQDAASTDETVPILKSLSARLTSWVSEPDTGQARAVLNGFEKISGDVMAWLNSDDVIMPGALRYVGEYFRCHPEVDVIYGHRVVIDEEGREIGRWVLPRHDPGFLQWIDYVPQETLYWRSSLWAKVGGVDPKFRFALDWDLLLRFQEAGARVVRVPFFLGCFRVHAVQKTSAAMDTVGAEEVAYVRRRTLGRLPEAEELSILHRRAERWSALSEWLLEHGVRW
jgi:GT2 family glycosyltransferase